MTKPCRFCEPVPDQLVRDFGLARVLWDGHPVSDGHTLVVTARHVASMFEAEPDERQALVEALAWARAELDRSHEPGGYTVGINDGPVAGQSVPHCHIHLIPRYDGDVADPRGGVRWVLPEKAAYWR